jgi:hypothetical protein
VTDFYVAAPGETAPPVPDGPRLCQGDDMRIVHNAFLWGYERAPGLVRGVAAGDTARSELVGRWLADLDATLHVHHESEDTLLWDRLEGRAPACALHVGQMRAHHARVQELLREAEPLLTRWRATADPGTGDRLADAYERMLAVLTVHLRREVVEMIPVVEKVLTEAEWAELGEHSMGAIPRSRLLPQLGFLITASPDAGPSFLAGAPRPVRWMYRLVGRRQFERTFRGLFPGEPVPRTV